MAKPKGKKKERGRKSKSEARPPRRQRSMSSGSSKSSARTERSEGSSEAGTESDTSMCSEDRELRDPSYARIKAGVRKSIPAAVVLYAFRKLDASNGLTSRRIINFLKERFKLKVGRNSRQRNVGKIIGNMLRSAVEFGVLKKRGTRFFLASRQQPRSGREREKSRSKRRGRSSSS